MLVRLSAAEASCTRPIAACFGSLRLPASLPARRGAFSTFHTAKKKKNTQIVSQIGSRSIEPHKKKKYTGAFVRCPRAVSQSASKQANEMVNIPPMSIA